MNDSTKLGLQNRLTKEEEHIFIILVTLRYIFHIFTLLERHEMQVFRFTLKEEGFPDGKYSQCLDSNQDHCEPTVNRPICLALRLPFRHIDLGKLKLGTYIYPSSLNFFFYT